MKPRFFLSLILVAALMLSCSNDDDKMPQPEPFTYGDVAGMSTGNTSVAGTAAPAGYTWSEVKIPQISWGQGAPLDINQLSEDFEIPSGEKWNIENFYFYAYQTNFSGTTFPVNEFYFEIYSFNPSLPGAVKLYGDMTTNRYISAEETKWYRILQGQNDNATRKIYRMKIQALDLNLTSGTYWIKWGSKASTETHFYPQFPHDETKANNALQLDVINSTWKILDTGGQNVSIPFEIMGTKLPN